MGRSLWTWPTRSASLLSLSFMSVWGVTLLMVLPAWSQNNSANQNTQSLAFSRDLSPIPVTNPSETHAAPETSRLGPRKSEPLKVFGIIVDRTASSATEARQQAMDDVISLALKDLLALHAPSETTGPLLATLLTAEHEDPAVKSIDLVSEKYSGTRYLGEFCVHFDRVKMTQRLAQHGITLASPQPQSILILPILHDASGQAYLWEDDHRWRDLWNHSALDQSLHTIHLPFGDLDDQMAMPSVPLRHHRMDPATLLALKQRYGVKHIFAAHLYEATSLLGASEPPSASQPTSSVILQDLIKGQETSVKEATDPSLPQSMLVVATLKKLNTLGLNSSADPQQQIGLILNFSQLTEAQRILSILQLIPSIETVKTLAITTRQRFVSIVYRGDIAHLASDLKQRGLEVQQTPEGVHVSLASAAPPSLASPR